MENKNDELIWKQDALDAFNVDMSGISVTISGRGAGKVYGYVKTVTDRIKALPPVQPDFATKIDLAYRAGYEQGRIDFYLGKVMKAKSNQNADSGKIAGDTISRQAAIDALDCINGVEEVLRSLPPVRPERIEGHWIEIALRNHTYKCSVCGRLLVNITDGKNNVAKNYPYCHCGADMRSRDVTDV